MQHQHRRRAPFCQQGNAEIGHQPSPESSSILEELNLGQHMLFILSDGSIEMFAYDERVPAFAETGICLDGDETYRLFISLHEQFQPRRDCYSSTDEKGRDTNG